jgi:uncharacterized protein (TIGR00725 family)
MSKTRRGLIGVMGSGTDEHAHLALPLGRWLAEQGFDLLTGGGRGVMAAVCRGFAGVPGRGGVSVGVLPAGPPPGYPNPWVDVVIQTHLPDRGEAGASERSRNHINVLSAHVVIALPGGPGTRTEVELALRYGRPPLAYLGPDGAIAGLTRDQLPAVAVTQAEVEAFILRHARP